MQLSIESIWVIFTILSSIGILTVYFNIFKKDIVELAKYQNIKKIFGFVILVIGIIGIFLPFIPGILLVIWGLSLMENTVIKRWIDKMRIKYRNRKNS